VKTRKSTIYVKRGEAKVLKIRGSKTLPAWRSNNGRIVGIPQRGSIQALAPGKANVYARARKKNYRVTVKVMDMDRSVVALKQGTKTKIKVINGASSVKWKTSDKSVVTVKKGTLTAKKSGRATITATTRGKTFVCNVNVPAASFPVKELFAKPQNSTGINYSASVAKVTVVNNVNAPSFASSNPGVASVDESGNVTALRPGTVNISATVDGLVFSFPLKVSDRPVDIYLNLVEKYSNYVKANGKYVKRADTPTLSFQEAVSLIAKKKKVKVNCRAHCTWAFREMGFTPFEIYAKNGTFIGRFKGPMTMHLTRITTGGPVGMSFKQAIDSGQLKRGDICAFKGKTHTFTYSGVGYKFFDGGSVVQKAGYSKVGFLMDYSKVSSYKKNTIGEVLRWNY
jgi:hypothetical protein